MWTCEDCLMKFDSLPVLHRHIQRFCDVRQKNETWWKKVEEEDSDEHLSQVSLVKVAELRHLKKKKAKWRQERATEDSFLLERLASTYHSQGPEEKWREWRNQKAREREVRFQVQQEQYDNATSQISGANHVLHSLNKELGERIHKVENARIRIAIGAPAEDSVPVHSQTIGNIHEKIKTIEETFDTAKFRLHQIQEGVCRVDSLSNFTPSSIELPVLQGTDSDISIPSVDGRLSDEEAKGRSIHIDEHEQRERLGKYLQSQPSPVEEPLTEHLKKIPQTRETSTELRSPDARARPSVLAEIRAVRESYLRQGGSDPNVLASIRQLEQNSTSLTDGETHHKSDGLHKITDQLAVLEEENEKINKQLQQLQGQSVDDHHLDLARPATLVAKQKEYESQWLELREELELLRQQVALQRIHHEVDTFSPRRRWPPVCRSPQRIFHQETSPTLEGRLPSNSAPEGPASRSVVPLVLKPSTHLRSPAKLDFDPLLPAPYDPRAGLVIFYDFVLGLGSTSQACGLVASLYTEERRYGEPGKLPTVQCEAVPSFSGAEPPKMALLAARQPVIRCWPSKDMSLVVELQITEAQTPLLETTPTPESGSQRDSQRHLAGTPGQMADTSGQLAGTAGQSTYRGWCKINLFDDSLRLQSGWWRILVRDTPILLDQQISTLNTIPKFGEAELFLRLVNHRDAADQADIPVDVSKMLPMYCHPQQVSRSGLDDPNGTGHSSRSLAASLLSKELRSHEGSAYKAPDDSLQVYSPMLTATPSEAKQCEVANMAIQIVHVKHVPPGEAKLRITVYDSSKGQVAQGSSGPVNYNTTISKMSFRHQYYIFGHQEVVFNDLHLTPDLVLVVRMYLREDRRYNHSAGPDARDTAGDRNEEKLIAWAAMHLVRHSSETRATHTHLVEGTHTLQLYRAPVPHVLNLTKAVASVSNQPYGRAFVKILIFPVAQRPGSLSPSEISSDDDDGLDQPWLPCDHHESIQNKPFEAGDGFDVYIDGCRFLPDGVTITRVAGRILDRQFQKVGRDISATNDLEGDMYNPSFRYRLEVRELQVPPTATLLLKVYTINQWSKELVVLGSATLNIFNMLGSTNQPSSDANVQVALNAGGHQVRLYNQGPTGIEPLTGTCLSEVGARYVPCATLLLRIVHAPVGSNGHPLESAKVPPVDWERLGLWVAPPDYNQRHYQSMLCVPSIGERYIYHSQVRRAKVLVKDSLHLLVPGPELRALNSNKSIQGFIKGHLTKLLETAPGTYDLTFITKYSPKHGIMVALDGAENLPWYGFSHATICLSPPAALYKGPPSVMYDRPEFTTELALDTTNRAPQWMDGYKAFTYRSYHPRLTAVIHIHEVVVSVEATGYKYNLVEQGWTVLPVFKETYAVTAAYQLPLFEGSPKEGVLAQLASLPYEKWRETGVNRKTFMPGASVWVRVVDGRRMEEVPQSLNEKAIPRVEVDTSYLPDAEKERYLANDSKRTRLRDLIPAGKAITSFNQNFAAKFKSLVYRLYNAGRLT